MTRNSLLKAGVTTLAALGLAASAQAQTLYVSQVGAGGATATTSAATAVFIDQFAITGTNQTALSQLALPTTASSSSPYALTESGSATSEGALALSADGKYLVIAGYNDTTGTASVASTVTTGTPVANQRVVGLVTVPSGGGSIAGAATDTSTALTAFSANNIRSATSFGGATPNVYSVGANTGVVEASDGATGAGTIVSNTVTNNRVINTFGSDLYFSTGSGTRGIYKITGAPTSTGNTATNVVNTGSTSSPYDFVFTNATTLYVADDRTSATSTGAGGLLQFTDSGSGFTLTNTYNLAGITAGTTAGLRGLTFDGSSTFYGISTDNRLVSFDTGTTSFATLATGTAGGQFRGVEFVPGALAPVPEPSCFVALAIGAGVLGLMVARRRNVAA